MVCLWCPLWHCFLAIIPIGCVLTVYYSAPKLRYSLGKYSRLVLPFHDLKSVQKSRNGSSKRHGYLCYLPKQYLSFGSPCIVPTVTKGSNARIFSLEHSRRFWKCIEFHNLSIELVQWTKMRIISRCITLYCTTHIMSRWWFRQITDSQSSI